MKPAARQIALERMRILIDNAVSNARDNPALSQRQASIARRISTKYRIRMPYEIRMTFCKKCKSFIAPGVRARIRTGGSTARSIRITCGYCGHVYRKMIRTSGVTRKAAPSNSDQAADNS